MARSKTYPSAAPTVGFFARLKRHHLFRAASLYATVAYVLVLVANAVFPDVGLTRGDVRYVIGVLTLGFPLALTASWLLVPPSREDPSTFGRSRRLRSGVGVAVALLVVGFVAISGVSLWRLDATHGADARASIATSVVALPFDALGQVDASLPTGIRDTLETTLASIGSVGVISHTTLSSDPGPKHTDVDLARQAGAAFLIQGSIQRADAHSPYTVHADLISTSEGATVFSMTDTFASNAPSVGIEQEIASDLAGPMRFLSRPDDWLAAGYPTTRNPRAMQLLREALMAALYDGAAQPSRLVRDALDLDPRFAQAHAYLGYFMLWEEGLGPLRPAGEAEIARAQALVPDLPEAHLARGLVAWLDNDDKTVLKEFDAAESRLPRNFLLHFTYGRELSFRNRNGDALKEIEAAQAIDPFQSSTGPYLARLAYFDRDYELADGYLAVEQANWPLDPLVRLWRAQTAFAYHGDVAAYAQVIDGDWSAYVLDGSWLAARRIEVAALEGRHQDALTMLERYPQAYLEATRFYNSNARSLWRDSFAVETLRLLGRDQEAAQRSALALPAAKAEAAHSPADYYVTHVALLQALGGDRAEALATVAPLLARYRGPPSKEHLDDDRYFVDVAIVLAWCGDKAGALELLSRSLGLPNGAHAAILAHDPVWRPLYSDPGFKALLAAHGQALAYAK